MEQKLNFNTINLLLSDIGNLKNHGEVVERKTNDENDYDGSYFVIKLNEETFGKDVYIKVEDSTDSYGNDYSIDGIQFVKPTQVIITGFETI